VTKRHVATHAAVALATAAAMYGGGGAFHAAPAGPTPMTPGAAATDYCDASLWSHVYHPERFTILDPCTHMTGVVLNVKFEADSDAHIQVRPDPAYASMLNGANQQLQAQALVVEPICARPPATQPDAVMPCAGYTNEVWIPPVGAHVRAVGPWVTDTQHGWNEIHAPTSIDNASG
jgi:hypothetical protein